MRGLVMALVLAAAPATAQQFTTAAEVKPILEATRANWVAVREYEGRDLVYFTHLLAWRCGLTSVRFSINSTAADIEWPMEPCYEGTAQPNAIKLPEFLPYVEVPLGAAQEIAVVIEMDDGSFLKATFPRVQVLMP